MSDRPLALITGASSGIGAALALRYAAHGWDLVLTARREGELRAVAERIGDAFEGSIRVVPEDLADPDAPARLMAACGPAGPDAVVNNAGYSRTTSFEATPLADHQAMLRVMLNAPVELARLALPGMRARGFGRILNVASVAGFLPATGGDTLYAPIKGFLIQASRGLWLETRGTGVHVTALCPGLTRSGFHEANGSIAEMSRAAPHWAWMSAEAVARIGYDACEANRPVAVTGLLNQVAVGLLRLMPDGLAMTLAAGRSRRLGRL